MAGSRDEVSRWQRAHEEQQRANQELLARVNTLEQRTTTAPPPAEDPAEAFVAAIEQVALDGKKEAGTAFAKKFLTPSLASTPSPGMTPAQVTALIAEQAETTRLREEASRSLMDRNKDVFSAPDLRPALHAAYTALVNDPMTAILYPPDTRGIAKLEGNGVTYDLRLLDRAAAEVRQGQRLSATAAQEHRQQGEQFPAQGGGAQHAPTSSADQIVVPAEFVRGEDALFNDPRIRKAMEVVTGEKDPRKHVEHFYTNAPELDKTKWRQQASLDRR